MKKIRTVMITGCLGLLSLAQINAQQATDGTPIASHPLAVAYSKTTHIIFPYAILSVDRGSKDLLAQKAKGVENILQVKAARESFPQTNLTVVTADGKLTSFIVSYTDEPAVLNLSMEESMQPDMLSMPSDKVNEQEIREYAEKAISTKAKGMRVSDKSFGVGLELNGIFIHDDMMYLRVGIANRTSINYDVDQFRLYIRDQKKARRTASQEIEVLPVLVHNNRETFNGGTTQQLVFAVPKFTIPDKKYLALQLMKKNGGRHLVLRVKNKKIIKAVALN